jgi:hypothetical protein
MGRRPTPILTMAAVNVAARMASNVAASTVSATVHDRKG